LQGLSGYVLIWASAPPNIFFAQMGKYIDPFLAIFFCPTKNLTAATPLTICLDQGLLLRYKLN